MHPRIERQRVFELRPELPKALINLSEAAASTLPGELVHLIKIRCSQINGCAFCVHMHMAEARDQGEKQSRLDTVSVWKEAPWFSDRERAALAFSEALTRLPSAEVPDDTFSALRHHFSEQEIVDLTVTIIVINGWNRLVAAMRFQPARED